ncbi:MAG: hypothetical protein HKN32_07945 [Flavobacteriales bacterium]|nr:hypothetical protein [Flavobacteriales bacterium]
MDTRTRNAAQAYMSEAALIGFIASFFAAVAVASFVTSNPIAGFACSAITVFFGFVSWLEFRTGKRFLQQ